MKSPMRCSLLHTGQDYDRSSSSHIELTEESPIVGSNCPTTQNSLPRVGALSGKDPSIMDGVEAKMNELPRRSAAAHSSVLEADKKSLSSFVGAPFQSEAAHTSTQESKWEKSFQRLKEFKSLHGHCRVPSKVDRPLSVWVNNQRYQLHANRRCKYKQDRIDRLDNLGFDWGFNHPNSSKRYASISENPADNLLCDLGSENVAVGRAVHPQHDAEVMDCAATILALSNAGNTRTLTMPEGNTPTIAHDHRHALRQKGFNDADAVTMPYRNDNLAMIQRVNTSRDLNQRIQRWNRMQYFWNNRAFFHGPLCDSMNPQRAWSGNDKNISVTQDAPHHSECGPITGRRDESLSSSSDVALQPRTFSKPTNAKTSIENRRAANQHDINWLKSFERLKQFHAEFGHTQVSRKQDKTLYTWASNQRQYHHEGHRYRQERVDLLNSIGFQWGVRKHVTSSDSAAGKGRGIPRNHDDFHGCDCAVDEIELNDNISEVGNNSADGILVHAPDSVEIVSVSPIPDKSRVNTSQYMELNGSRLPLYKGDDIPVHYESLRSSDAADSPSGSGLRGNHQLNWQNRFDQLKQFSDDNGHCRVQKKHNKELHSWVHNQRTSLCGNALGYRKERVNALNSIGFCWGTDRRISSSVDGSTIDDSHVPDNDSSLGTKGTVQKLKFERPRGFKAKKSHTIVRKGRSRDSKCFEMNDRTQGRDCTGSKKDGLNAMDLKNFEVENQQWIANCDQRNARSDCATDTQSSYLDSSESCLLEA